MVRNTYLDAVARKVHRGIAAGKAMIIATWGVCHVDAALGLSSRSLRPVGLERIGCGARVRQRREDARRACFFRAAMRCGRRSCRGEVLRASKGGGMGRTRAVETGRGRHIVHGTHAAHLGVANDDYEIDILRPRERASQNRWPGPRPPGTPRATE